MLWEHFERWAALSWGARTRPAAPRRAGTPMGVHCFVSVSRRWGCANRDALRPLTERAPVSAPALQSEKENVQSRAQRH